MTSIRLADDVLKVNNTSIARRKSDGFVDATMICRAGKRQLGVWTSRKCNKAFLSETSKNMKTELSEIYIIHAGPQGKRHTWVHPVIAVKIAQWTSQDIGLRVEKWLFPADDGSETDSETGADDDNDNVNEDVDNEDNTTNTIQREHADNVNEEVSTVTNTIQRERADNVNDEVDFATAVSNIEPETHTDNENEVELICAVDYQLYEEPLSFDVATSIMRKDMSTKYEFSDDEKQLAEQLWNPVYRKSEILLTDEWIAKFYLGKRVDDCTHDDVKNFIARYILNGDYESGMDYRMIEDNKNDPLVQSYASYTAGSNLTQQKLNSIWRDKHFYAISTTMHNQICLSCRNEHGKHMRRLFTKIFNMVGDVREYLCEYQKRQYQEEAQLRIKSAEDTLAAERKALEDAEEKARIAEEEALKLQAEKRMNEIRKRFVRFESPEKFYAADGYIYIETSEDDFKRYVFGIGMTYKPPSRLTNYKSKSAGEAVRQFLKLYKVWNMRLVETVLKEVLKPWSNPDEKAKSVHVNNRGFSRIELFDIPYPMLVRVVEFIVQRFQEIAEKLAKLTNPENIIADAQSNAIYMPIDIMPENESETSAQIAKTTKIDYLDEQSEEVIESRLIPFLEQHVSKTNNIENFSYAAEKDERFIVDAPDGSEKDIMLKVLWKEFLEFVRTKEQIKKVTPVKGVLKRLINGATALYCRWR
jgi:hypothetical protein